MILGIDPGTTGMGYAFLVAAPERALLLECGVVDVRASTTAAERLLAISEALDELIRLHRPFVLAVERLYFNKNVQTAMRVSEARGVALLCAARASLEIAEYTPQEVKISVTGNGRGDKKAVQRMLPLLVAIDAPITQDNVADAVAIALTHAQRSHFAAAVEAASTKMNRATTGSALATRSGAPAPGRETTSRERVSGAAEIEQVTK